MIETLKLLRLFFLSSNNNNSKKRHNNHPPHPHSYLTRFLSP